MPLKTPKFWYQPFGWKAALLLPFAWLYQCGHRMLQFFRGKPYKSSIPIICIGNAVAGGGGKTPTAIALITLIKRNKLAENPVFLTRGYGGQKQDAAFVNLSQYNVAQNGDEAYLLAHHAPTIIAKNRAQGAKLAEKEKADLIIMDDGFFNTQLHKGLSFLVIDRTVNFGNGKTIPAGPLREPLSRILPKANAVICIGDPLHSDKPVFTAQIKAEKKDYKGDYVAFAGLARPKKFLNTLHSLNINIVSFHEFADHHVYSENELNTLLAEAKMKNAALITTEKDHIRLPENLKGDIQTLPITIDFDKPSSILNYLKSHLK